MQKLRYLIPLLIVVFLSLSYSEATAQYENTSGQKKEGEVKKRPKPQKPKRWFVGGMLGAGFSSQSAYVELAPVIGFVPVKNLHLAARFSYIYNSREILHSPYGYERINQHHYSIGAFVRYIFFKGIFGQVEYEMLSYDDKWYDNIVSSPTYGQLYEERVPFNTLFLGGGFFQTFGNGGFASFTLLYPIAVNYESFYNAIVFRIGFGGFF